MQVALVVLDWSGTISDDRMPVYEANMAVLKKFGKPVLTFEEWLQESMIDAAELFWKYGVQGDRETLNKLYKQELESAHARGLTPTIYPDVRDTLEFLSNKKIKLAVVSSHPKENLLKEIKKYGLDKLLLLVIGDSKDKIADLKQIAHDLKIKPGFGLYIDDTVWGIRAAKKAGFKSAAILTGYHLKERLSAENPDIILEKLSDLKKHIT